MALIKPSIHASSYHTHLPFRIKKLEDYQRPVKCHLNHVIPPRARISCLEKFITEICKKNKARVLVEFK